MCLTLAFELLYFLANWCTLLAGNLSKLTLPSLMVLDTKSSSFRKKTKDVHVMYFGCFQGYLAKFTCACMALYHSSTIWFPCLKLVSRSNLAQTSLDCGLQYSLYFSHIVSRVRLFEDKFQDTYWSILQSLLHAITFLHCWHSSRAASLHSKIFLHLRCYLRNL